MKLIGEIHLASFVALAVTTSAVATNVAHAQNDDALDTKPASGNPQSVSGTIKIDDDSESETGIYLRLNAGTNILEDVKFKDLSLVESSIFVFGDVARQDLRNLKLSYDAGFDLNLALGFDLSESLSIEISTGFSQNDVSGASGDYSGSLRTLDPFSGDLIDFNLSGNASGGSGDITQVPVMANVRYGIDVSDSIEIGFSAGFGVQYTDINVNNVDISGTFTETITPLVGPPVTSTGSFGPEPLGNFSGNGWSLRGQLGADLQWEITDNVYLGIYARYSATTETDFGNIEGVDTKINTLQNIAIGGSLGFTF